MSSPVALIFGAGKNVGTSVAKALTANGYRVAVASRTNKHTLSDDQYFHTTCDLADPSSVEQTFEAVRQELGHPNVVVYNASTHISSPDRDHPLGLPLSDLTKTLNVNLSSAYVAAQQAVSSFEHASSNAPKAFIYTGNRTNIAPIPPLLSQGLGKAAAANMMMYLSTVYQQKGYKFYYADERKADGSPVYGKIDGPAHGEFYTQLAKGDAGDVSWLATFVKGQGYKDFEETAKL